MPFMVFDGDALRELGQFRPHERLLQLGLPDDDELQQQLVTDVHVRQQTQFFERLDVHVLGFVDDEDNAPPLKEFRRHEVDELLVHLDLVGVFALQPEGRQDPREQVTEIAMGVGDDPNGHIAADMFEDVANEGGFARAYFARDEGETGLAAQTVFEHGKRHGVLLAQIQEVRIGRQGEGPPVQAEKSLVHGV